MNSEMILLYDKTFMGQCGKLKSTNTIPKTFDNSLISFGFQKNFFNSTFSINFSGHKRFLIHELVFNSKNFKINKRMFAFLHYIIDKYQKILSKQKCL